VMGCIRCGKGARLWLKAGSAQSDLIYLYGFTKMLCSCVCFVGAPGYGKEL